MEGKSGGPQSPGPMGPSADARDSRTPPGGAVLRLLVDLHRMLWVCSGKTTWIGETCRKETFLPWQSRAESSTGNCGRTGVERAKVSVALSRDRLLKVRAVPYESMPLAGTPKE